MTTAPQVLTDVRALLLRHLDIHESSRAYPVDLDPAEVGIVGDPAHRGGYHCGSDRTVTGDYSVVESSRDRSGLSSYSCALDVGDFSIRVGGRTHDLRSFSTWLAAQCRAGAAGTADIREVIYSPDGTTVRRWDRLGRRSTGDSSHRWHTHISYHRDAIKTGRSQVAVYRRYLTEIGLIAAAPTTDTTTTTTEEEETTMTIVKRKGDDTCHLLFGDGTKVRALTDPDALKGFQAAGVKLTEVPTQKALDDMLAGAERVAAG